MFSKLGVRTQLVIIFVLLSVFSVSLQIYFTSRSVMNVTMTQAKELIEETSTRYSVAFADYFNIQLQMAEDSASMLISLKSLAKKNQSIPSRDQANEFLATVLENNPNVFSIWTVWEPNAFDGEDEKFANKTLYDSTGRMATNWFIDKGEVKGATVKDYNTPGKDSFYTDVIKSGQNIVTDPFNYTVDGVDYTLVTLASPIKENGVTIGVCGIDIPLNAIIDKVTEIKPFGVGKSTLISDTGLVIASYDKNLIGKNFSSIPDNGTGIYSQLHKLQLKGESFRQIVPKGWSNTDDAFVVSQVFEPVNNNRYWSFLVSVPYDKLYQPTAKMIELGIKVGLAVLIIAIVFGLISVKFVIGSLTRHLMKTVEDLENSSYSLNDMVNHLNVTSGNISAGAQSQASSLEETSAALEEINSMTRKNAENAQLTNQTTADTINLVLKGAEDVSHMGEAMMEINDSASKINNIIKTIEDIAFQTNLLALNAAVEAARAGEAGSGFAVVAEEVRNLAMRSAEAAKSTSDLIESTISRVKKGTDIATLLNTSFNKVKEASSNIQQLVEQIASATSEQDTGISQIKQAVINVDKVTQSNVLSVQNMVEAINRMSTQSDEMNRIISSLLEAVSGNSKKK